MLITRELRVIEYRSWHCRRKDTKKKKKAKVIVCVPEPLFLPVCDPIAFAGMHVDGTSLSTGILRVAVSRYLLKQPRRLLWCRHLPKLAC